MANQPINPEDRNPTEKDEPDLKVTHEIKVEDTAATVSDQPDIKKNPDTHNP